MVAKPILVVDDESHIRVLLFEALTRQGHSVDVAENGLEALEKFKDNHFDLVIADDNLPRLDGLGVLREIKKTSAVTPVILISDSGTVATAVEAMREGAFDYILKPLFLGMIEETVARALNGSGRSASTAQARDDQQSGFRPIVTNDPGMKRLLNMAASVASSRATVLIQGESGTGKELLARHIHAHSDRDTGPFVAINCASLPEGLLESELFGHEKGAFTGAITKKPGKFELADQGTILLDEISEMDLALQAKLLRVLQEGEVDRVGGKTPTKIDVRVIATTNRHLKEWVEQGRFRQDLYYRLNVIPLTIPPLRERRGDIPTLVDHFLEKFSKPPQGKRLAKRALERLSQQEWPGNVRELENIIARGVLLSSGPEVDIDALFLDEAPPVSTQIVEDQPADTPLMTIREMEKGMIYKALDQTEGNRTHAAKILGISVRTLRNKLAEYQ